tara:strand:+ start:638 stop:1039 length:402 start_codon:yes stop_codon:yes gene_type:complete
MFDIEVSHLNNTWKYRRDMDQYGKKDYWKVMKKPPYEGDCEDYALTMLYLISGKSWLKFWMYLFTFRAKLCLVTTKNGQGHGVLKFRKMYIDNWTKKFVTKEEMEAIGHKFHSWRFMPTTVAIRMFIAKVFGG